METDTIAATATAAGEAGIAIVRISGPDALVIADTAFRGKGRLAGCEGGRFLRGRVVAADRGEADEVIALVYRAPHSYTREDVVEFQCHGGRVAVRRVLAAVLASGARPAQPGEFTRRAFLSGRIDLAQAEAVADLIAAKSERAARAALEQLEGRLSSEVGALHDGLMSLAADVEASLDFGDDELPEGLAGNTGRRLDEVRAGLGRLLATWQEGHALRDGALVAIAGRPNAGKSTMMNALLGKDRAIVDHEPGTTRDTIEEGMVLDGIPLRLVDTAGLRDSADRIESQGVRRALAAISRADLVLYVADASRPMPDEERAMLAGAAWPAGLVALNKTDLGRATRPGDIPKWPALECCLRDGSGLGDIKAAIPSSLGLGVEPDPGFAISERHRAALQATLRELDAAVAPACRCDPSLVAWHFRKASGELGAITGRDYSAELLDRIFSRFCVGK